MSRPRLIDLSKSLAPFLLTLAFCLPALLPLLAPGFPRTHDGLGHLFRIVELDRALRAGVLYPRWATELAMGYGYPVLNFYAPLSYYAVEAVHLLGLGFLAAYKAALAASLLLAGLAAYLLARDVLDDRLAAVLSAVAYVVAPYTLADAYLRGALGESWTLVFIPLSLWAFRRLVTMRRPAYAIVGALSFAALILSHNAIALMALPLLLAYLSFLLWRERANIPSLINAPRPPSLGESLADGSPQDWGVRGGDFRASEVRRRVGTSLPSLLSLTALALILALALSAFYWLPALAEKQYTYVDALLTGFHGGVGGQLIEPWRLVQLSPAYDYAFDPATNPFRLGLAPALAALGGLAALRIKRLRAPLLFFALATAVVLFLMTPLSLLLWETVPLIAFVEFPWRLLTLAGLGTALLTGGLVAAWPRRRLWRGAVFLAAVVALVLAGLWDLHPPTSSITEGEVNAATAARFDYDVGAIGTNKASEYLPLTVKENPTQLPRGDLLVRGIPAGPAPDLALLRVDPFAVDLVTSADSPGGPVVLHQFAFPGWSAWVDDKPVPVEPVGSLGLVRIDVPAGKHRVSFRFTDTPVRTLANLGSLAGLVGLMVVLVWARSWRGLAAVGALTLALGLLLVLSSVEPPPPPGVRRGQMWSFITNYQVDFGPGLRLLGYEQDTSRLNTDREMDVTLYWQARQPLTTSHIIDVGLATEAKADHGVLAVHRGVPGYGVSPTTKWEVGEIVVDRRTLRLTQDAPPGRHVLAMAVRQAPEGSYIEVAPGQVIAWLISIPVDATGVPPAHVPAPQHERYVPLQGIIELVGFDTEPAFAGDTLTAHPGQPLVVTPHWRAADAWVPYDYTIRLTLRDGAGHVAHQADYSPIYDVPATALWGLDHRAARALPFPLPTGLSPGDYVLECELYHGYDEQRLWPLRADRAAFDLFTVRVQPY